VILLIPAFAVPLSLILHALSLRQLRRSQRNGLEASLAQDGRSMRSLDVTSV